MKKITFLLFIINFSVLSQSVNGEAIYSKKAIVNDSIKQSKNIESFLINKIKKITDDLEYTLNFNSHNSVFEVINTNIDQNNLWAMAATSSDGGGIYYDDILNNRIIHKLDKFGETYLILSDRNNYSWKLFPNEKKQIGNYFCYKAQCTQTSISKNHTFVITAWYCPDIPVSTGPIGFTGLPGLILELNHDNRNVYSLKEIILNTKETKFKIPKKGKEVTKLEFEDILFKFMESRRN